MEVAMKLTEAPQQQQQYQQKSSRPTVGFPLGIVLLLIVLFIIIAIFCCCYHWDKLRHLRGEFSNHHPHRSESDHYPPKPKSVYFKGNRDEDRSLPVIMAGDQFPRFVAMPCPCEPSAQRKIAVEDIETSPEQLQLVIPID